MAPAMFFDPYRKPRLYIKPNTVYPPNWIITVFTGVNFKAYAFTTIKYLCTSRR